MTHIDLIDPFRTVANGGFQAGKSMLNILAADLSTAVGGGLIRDLPRPVDPDQVVKVDPAAT